MTKKKEETINKNKFKIIPKNKINLIKNYLKEENNKFTAIAYFFLILQFFVFLGNYKSDRYDVFFWFCNHTPLIFGLAFLGKKFNLIKGIINVGFLGQFAWTLDFLGKIFFNYHIFKMTNYVFENPNGLWVLLPIGIHIFSTNVAIYFTYKKKPDIYTAFYSLLYISFLYAGTMTYTLVERNVNWVYKIGGEINYSNPLYSNFWPLIVFFLIAMPTQLFQYYLWKKHKKKLKESLP